jgi:fluoride ion exporter CrcB/FEX
VALFEHGEWRRGATYVVLSVSLSLIGALMGIWLAGKVVAVRHGG